MEKLSTEVCKWLLSCSGVRSARPVAVTLKKEVFKGALYSVANTYEAGERAVEEGLVKEGEERLEHRMYLVGGVPKNTDKTAFTWRHNLQIDNRINESIGEWYVIGGYLQGDCVKPEFQQYHPFGINFILGEWLVPTHGYYKGHKIDTLERTVYQRCPMQVQFPEEPCGACDVGIYCEEVMRSAVAQNLVADPSSSLPRCKNLERACVGARDFVDSLKLQPTGGV